MKKYIASVLAFFVVWALSAAAITGCLMLLFAPCNIREELHFVMLVAFSSPGLVIGMIIGMQSAKNTYRLYKGKEGTPEELTISKLMLKPATNQEHKKP